MIAPFLSRCHTTRHARKRFRAELVNTGLLAVLSKQPVPVYDKTVYPGKDSRNCPACLIDPGYQYIFAPLQGKPMISKAIDTCQPIHDLLSRRWSGVAYDPQRDISSADILSLAEAARWAPSCFGDQPWRFIFFHRSADPQAWDKAFACLAEGNQPWNQAVPLLILTCHDTRFVQNDKPNAYGAYDSGAAAMSICTQATHLGLMTHQMAGFDPEKARDSFNIPERYQPKAMMAVGYQLPEDQIPEEFNQRELAPRQRRPLEDNFFAGTWGESLK
ncbi:MAG: nitroreductase family protein [Natronospirillum sp.]